VSVTEESRHRLHQALDRTIGEEEATTLMEHLPPVGWADVATKTDLDHLRTSTKTDLDHLRTTTKTDLDHLEERLELRFALLRTDINGRFNLVDERFSKVDVRFDGIDQRLDDMVKGFDKIENRLTYQFWQFLGLIVAFGGVLIAVLRFT
jgi:hypothetical protein